MSENEIDILKKKIIELEKLLAGRKQTEETLRESEQKFKSLIESTSDWIWQVDENAVYTYASPKIRELLGYEPEEIIGKTPFDLMSPEEAKRIAAEFGEISKERKSFSQLENTNIHKDGYPVVLESSGVPIFDNKGSFRGYQGIDRDITGRKKAEEEIKALAKEWQRTFDSISDLVFIMDNNYTILRVNKALAEALKAKPEDIVSKKCYELLHKTNRPWPDCPFERTKKDKAAHIQEVDDANIGIPLLVTTAPILNDRGELTGSVHIAKDITLIKDKEKELTRKIRDLEIFNEVAVDRELKMEELKAKIKELEGKLGRCGT